MKLSLVCLVILGLSSTATAGPLRSALTQAAQTPPPTAQRVTNNPAMLWGGVALAAGGAALMLVGLEMDHRVACASVLGVVVCQEAGGSRNALIGAGLGAVGGGIALAAIGGKKVVVAPSRHGIVGAVRFYR